MSTPEVTEAFAPFTNPDAGKPCQTYYKILGTLAPPSTDGNPDKVPIIVIHGGPGGSHDYLLPLADLALPSYRGAPIIFYDQIGGGRSTHLPEKRGEAGAAFWTTDLFVDEFHNLVKWLGLDKDGATFDLIGHSFGGKLGMEIATRAGRPRGLRRLVLSSSSTAMSLWAESTRKLLGRLPQDVQDTITKHEAAGTIDSPEYKEATAKWDRQFTLRLDPWPDVVKKTSAFTEEDHTVYRAMQGPSEFTITGSLKGWDIRPELHKIDVPVLLTNGAFDGASDSAVAAAFWEVPKVKWVTFAESSHMPHWEERERYMRVVSDFLAM